MEAYYNAPAAAPPDGVLPNFKDPPNCNRSALVISSLFLAIATLFVLNRIYVKTWILGKYLWDDCRRPTETHFGTIL